MSHWNYRVHKKIFRYPSGEPEEYYSIHEAYYNDEGKLDGWTEKSISPGGSTLEELKNDLEMMLEALNKEIIDWEKMNEKTI